MLRDTNASHAYALPAITRLTPLTHMRLRKGLWETQAKERKAPLDAQYSHHPLTNGEIYIYI